MADGPINPDREQQRKDNIASRKQSGLEPRPEDLQEKQAAERDGQAAKKNEGEEGDRD